MSPGNTDHDGNRRGGGFGDRLRQPGRFGWDRQRSHHRSHRHRNDVVDHRSGSGVAVFSKFRQNATPTLTMETPQTPSSARSAGAFTSTISGDASATARQQAGGVDTAGVIIGCCLGLAAARVRRIVVGERPKRSRPGHADPAGLLAAGCLYRLWQLREPWLILYADRVEKRDFLKWRTLSRGDIEGDVGTPAPTAAASFRNRPVAPGRNRHRLRLSLRQDPIVDRWFRGARDLTAEAVAADRSAVLHDTRYRADETQRASPPAIGQDRRSGV